MPRTRVLGSAIKSIFGRKAEGKPPERAEYRGGISTAALREVFKDCGDFTDTPVYIGGRPELEARLCYVDGLVQGAAISENVLRPLTERQRFGRTESLEDAVGLILHGGVYNYNVRERTELEKLIGDLMNGFCAVVFDGLGLAVSFEVKSGEKRSIGEPTVEKAVKGAKDAFVETLRTNTGLLRRRLRTPELKLKELTLGSRSHTKTAVIWIEGLTPPETVRETIQRIESMNIDGVVSLGNIEDCLTEQRRTPFPQLIYTERVDRFCMNLLEGRVGVMIDGFPIAYLLPVSFSQFIKVPEDKAGHFAVTTLLTALRYMAAAVTLLLPGFYVAVVMYAPEMLPTKLMLSIIESKENVPFSTAAEVTGMLIAFEVLQEAGLRLPESIGQTVSIIGALVVGQSAVEAKVVSAVVVIIVATAGICGYTMPNQDMATALRLWRFVIVLAAIAGGMFGVAAACTTLIYHLASIENCGVAYIAPFAPQGQRIFGRWKGKAG